MSRDPWTGRPGSAGKWSMAASWCGIWRCPAGRDFWHARIRSRSLSRTDDGRREGGSAYLHDPMMLFHARLMDDPQAGHSVRLHGGRGGGRKMSLVIVREPGMDIPGRACSLSLTLWLFYVTTFASWPGRCLYPLGTAKWICCRSNLVGYQCVPAVKDI